jgi:type II secretory pathway pseudopilin PulG
VGSPHSIPAHSSRFFGQKRAGEAGYILIGVLILVALFFIALAVAAPIVAKDIERDKEVEAVQRGKQYTRAIKLYYKRYGNYPTTIKALENTNNIRYLRKRYTDPITGKDDWRLIHVGEAKVPVMGFFGKPLAGGTGSATTGLMGNGTGGIAGAGNSSAFGGSTGSSNTGFGTPIGGSPTDPGTTGDGSGGVTAGGAGGTLPGLGGGQSGIGAGATGANGTGTTGTGATGFNGSTTTGSGGSGFDGGGPIVGVGIPLSKKSLVVYHKQDAFNKWEFTYDPLQDQMMVSNSSIPGATAAGTPVGAGGATGNGAIPTTGTTGNSPFGSTPGSGTTPTDGSSGSTPTSPQN